MPEFSLITLTHNRLPWTRRCLPSWLESLGADWELVVVENGSTDGTLAWLHDFRPTAAARGIPVTILHNRHNAGCSTARNQGIAAARGEWLVFMDNDVALRTRTWMPRLRQTLQQFEGAMLAGPRLVYPMPPHHTQCAGVHVSRRGRITFRERGHPRTATAFTRPEPVQCLVSACLMAQAKAVRDCGGFDEIFNPVQFEDFDLCYRLRSNAGQALFDPGVEMYHFESTTTQGPQAHRNAANIIRNGLTFKRRWREMIESENEPEPVKTPWTTMEMPHPDTTGRLALQ